VNDDDQLVSLTINGRRRSVRATPTTTLLTILRDELTLTGAKRGCNQGVCGACTVLLDDRPVRSCLSLAMNLADRSITTIEGLAQKSDLAPIQRAMIENGAVQCGFCTSGVLVSAYALLRQNPHPDADETRAALSGNLCRCSGYIKIIEAVCRAGAEATP
jgi:carbon-monoxide dehydrogenase small subunit